jgi:hypothetical protein
VDGYTELDFPAEPSEAIEAELAYYRQRPSPGWIVFDLCFGLLAPAVLLLADPAVFTHEVAPRAAFPPHLALPTHVLTGLLGLALLVWLGSGAWRPLLGLVLAGPLGLGVLISLVLAAKLTHFGLVHSELLSGLLALTLWLTLLVFVRQTARAVRAGAQASVVLTLLSLLVGAAAPLTGFVLVAKERAEHARFLEALFLSDDEKDHERAVDLILQSPWVDLDRIADAYHVLPKDDARRERIARSYLSLTGEPMEDALRRLGYLPPPPPAPDAWPPEEEEEEPADADFPDG